MVKSVNSKELSKLFDLFWVRRQVGSAIKSRTREPSSNAYFPERWSFFQSTFQLHLQLCQ